MIDSAIANVALPTIGLELGISSADSIWIVNAYQLAIMVSLLSLSALGDVKVSVDLKAGTAAVESEALPDDAALRAAIEDLGFDCLSIENA